MPPKDGASQPEPEQKVPYDFSHDSDLREKRPGHYPCFRRNVPQFASCSIFHARDAVQIQLAFKSHHNLIKIAENQRLNPDDRRIFIWSGCTG